VIPSPEELDDLLERANRLCDGIASADDIAYIEGVVRADKDLCWAYLCYTHVHAGLRCAPVALHLSPEEEDTLPRINCLSAASEPNTEPPSFPFSPFTAFSSVVDYVSSGWPMAYLIATMVFAIGAVISAFTFVSPPAQVALESRSTVNGTVASVPTHRVGRITDSVACNLVGTEHLSRDVMFGSTFRLASGLLEITYDSGAKVILQGPVAYEVNSDNGGYLSRGKLTACVEKQVANGRRSKASDSEDSNPQNVVTIPSLATSCQPLFTITTPTATITDLGTEFGVEVNRDGRTTSRVYRGSVRLQVTSSDGKREDAVKILHKNEWASVERVTEPDSAERLRVLEPSGEAIDFVRAIPKQSTRILDLVDVVAGGDGFANHRNAGVDPRNGLLVRTWPSASSPRFQSDGKYYRVQGMPFIDGVFIPRGAPGRAVQLDSAGHSFAWFPKTDGRTLGPIWAGGGGAIGSAELAGVNYDSPGHAMLELHANKGITFDLDAIRRANVGWKILRFCGVAGNTRQGSPKTKSVFADLWVFVDGQSRFQRRETNRNSGAMPAIIPLSDKDRFLTFVATDGGDGYSWDHTIFGDPRLELVSAKARSGTNPPQNGTSP
jgi:hypothetical protein